MKANIKVEELVCLKIVSDNGSTVAIPLDRTFDPNKGTSGFDVFVNEEKDLTVIHHVKSGDCLVMDNRGSIIDNETLAHK